MTAPEDDDFRCARWTETHGFDPIGSAIRVDRLILVEIPLPWPSDVSDLAWIADLEVPDGVRIQTIAPDAPSTDGTVLLTRWTRSGAVLAGEDWRVPAPAVPETLAVLITGRDPTGPATPAPPELLVCGHGTRDRCCGSGGTRLAVEVRAALPEIRVRRTSHLGGHRFAPTALSLPEGRQWAFLDAPTTVSILRRAIDPADARPHYRGNIALDPWAQVAESTLLADGGWERFELTEVEATTTVAGDEARVELEWRSAAGPGSCTVAVAASRRYPILQCGFPPEEAVKEAVEYTIRS